MLNREFSSAYPFDKPSRLCRVTIDSSTKNDAIHLARCLPVRYVSSVQDFPSIKDSIFGLPLKFLIKRSVTKREVEIPLSRASPLTTSLKEVGRQIVSFSTGSPNLHHFCLVCLFSWIISLEASPDRTG